MTTAHSPSNPRHWLLGERVRVEHLGRIKPGRIHAVRRDDHGIEYIVRTDPTSSRSGEMLHIWTTTGRALSMLPASEAAP